MLLWDNTDQNSQDTNTDLGAGWASFSRMLSASIVKVLIARDIERANQIEQAKLDDMIETSKIEMNAPRANEASGSSKDVVQQPITAPPLTPEADVLDPVILPTVDATPEPKVDYGKVIDTTLDFEKPTVVTVSDEAHPIALPLAKPIMEVEQVIPKATPVSKTPATQEPEPEPEPEATPVLETPVQEAPEEPEVVWGLPKILPPAVAFEDAEPSVEDVVTEVEVSAPVVPPAIDPIPVPDPVESALVPKEVPVEDEVAAPVIPAPVVIAEPKTVNFIKWDADPLPEPEPVTPDTGNDPVEDPAPLPADFGDPFARPADFSDPLPLPLSDRSGDYAAVGVEDPGMAMNASGYLKWDEYSQVPFIDRMKGSHAWSGVKGEHYATGGDAYLTHETPLFKAGGQIVDVAFNNNTVVDIFRSLLPQDRALINEISAAPSDYFRISMSGSGNSILQGRLDTSDVWTTIVRFDRDIGMDLDELREAGHLTVSYADRFVDFYDLELDENGWPIELPSDLTGKEGSVATNVMWYPEDAADAPIYSGKFYLMVEGTGQIGLTHAGTTSDDMANINKFEVNGPTRIEFDHVPDGDRLLLRIFETDPDDTGDYIKNIRIVHEDHLDAYLAGEIFTPEYVDMMEDYRAIRFMDTVGGHHLHNDVEGRWEDRDSPDFYTTNLGTGNTKWNGWPIEAIIDLANKTGSDPWIIVPLNASDDYVRGMAEYVKENLDPRLKLQVEYGNELWNSAFESYKYARDMALDKWGELKLRTDASGNFVRDGQGNLIVEQDGFFFDQSLASANGYSMPELSAELDIPVTLKSIYSAWAEFASMRGTQVGKIFEDVWGADESGQLSNVMGAFTGYQRGDLTLMSAEFWKATDPDDWIDPASVFEGLAVGAYFGGDLGSTQLDLLKHWMDRYGEDGAMERVLWQLKIGSDPEMELYQFDKDTYVYKTKSVNPGKVETGVQYSEDLVIDVFDAIVQNNPALRDAIRAGDGVRLDKEMLYGADVDNYVRLTDISGKTHLQIRYDTSKQFETVLVFDSLVSQSVEDMIDDGTLVVRRITTIADAISVQAGEERMGYAEEMGYEVMAYEGGQHFAAAVWGFYRDYLNNTTITDFMSDLNQSEGLKELYTLWNDAWAENGGTLFAQFVDYAVASRYGSFGVVEYLGEDSSPKLDVITEINNEGAWWDEDRVAGTFLQGVNLQRGSSDDYMTGTVEEDVLSGGDGDDTLDAGTGDDALIGGAGADLILAGDGNDVVLMTDTDDTVDGGNGVDTVRIADVEQVRLSMLSLDAVEVVDTTNGQEDTIYVGVEDVMDTSGTASLFVTGERGDAIILDGFTQTGETEIGGVDYEIFVGTDNGRSVALYVEDDLIG